MITYPADFLLLSRSNASETFRLSEMVRFREEGELGLTT